MSEEQLTLPVTEQPLEQVFESPETLEAAMVAKEQEKPLEHGPADIAAAMFMRRLQILHQLVNKLSMKQLKRVILNVATYPLAGDRYKPLKQIEKDAVYQFNEMVTERMIMQLAAEQEKVLKSMEEKASAQQQSEQGESSERE